MKTPLNFDGSFSVSLLGAPILLIFLVFVSPASFAQYESEALRYAMLNHSGSARFLGMGSALGALGSDFSCISHNPAGLGFYRNSQLTVSPSFYLSTSNADYQGQTFADDKFNFNFGSIGLVYSLRTNRSKKTGLQFMNFALGYNRINNFNQIIYFEGMDSQYSLGESLRQNSQGYMPASLNPFESLLAFNTYLIDTSGNASYYISNAPANLDKRMSRLIHTRGSIGEIALGASANFSHKFFVGANLSIATLNFKTTQTYEEIDYQNLDPDFNSLRFTEDLDVSGVGVNLKLGFIYRPLNWFRVGLSIHTPTWYNMSETYVHQLQTDFNFGKYSAQSPAGSFDYDFTSPWRLQASLGFVLRKRIALGVDYELVDYGAISLRPSSSTFLDANAFIDSHYVVTHNIRLGGEFRIDPFRIRAGYRYQMNPLSSALNTDLSAHHISVGGGYRARKWFTFDVAYVLTLTHSSPIMNRYFDLLPPASVSKQYHNVVITVGFHF